jgi:hypothetical protein
MNVSSPAFLWDVFNELRRLNFPLSMGDWEDLRTALRLGFGWSSEKDLINLCCTLWANSRRDCDIIHAAFSQFDVPEWQLAGDEKQRTKRLINDDDVAESDVANGTEFGEFDDEPDDDQVEDEQTTPAPVPERSSGLPPLSLGDVELPASHLVHIAQYPMSYREVAQAWRRVRKPARFGPQTEIDIRATINHAAQMGLLAGPVLVSPRRNLSSLLLLVDSQGSMTPFQPFVQQITEAITSATSFGRMGVFYFHDVPAEGAHLQEEVSGMFPELDTILEQILPLSTGYLFDDEALTIPCARADVIEQYAPGANVGFISDGGAARGTYDFNRLRDTIGSLKYLRQFTHTIVWLNPLPVSRWQKTTAAQIARHVPMFTVEPEGLRRAVVALKAQFFSLERPL